MGHEVIVTGSVSALAGDLPVVGDDALEGDAVDVTVEEVAGDAADRGEVPVEHRHAHRSHQLCKCGNVKCLKLDLVDQFDRGQIMSFPWTHRG